jgi:protein SCO1/2/putative membrane protein
MRRLVLLLCIAAAGCRPVEIEDDGPVGTFRLTERSGRPVTQEDLSGKTWIASFVFTRCTGPCPQITATVARLQSELADQKDLRFVTFTVDPEHDDPHELSRYAEHFGADPERWLFLTGKEKEIYALLREGFHVHAEQNKGSERKAGAEVMHDTHLVLVDGKGHIRGYFSVATNPLDPDSEGSIETNLRLLRARVRALSNETAGVDFPALNAGLNAAAGVLILLGYACIRQRKVYAHAVCMLTAIAVSATFLASYLYYHIAIRHGIATKFHSQWPDAPSWVMHAYYALLTSHTLLAVAVAPLAPYTAWQALRGRIQQHVRLARWTLPMWLYVSLTGVLVYWMLYRLYAPA